MNDSLSSAEEKAVSVMLEKERNFYGQFIKGKSGAFCTTYFEYNGGEYIDTSIVHGYQNDTENQRSEEKDRIVRATMRWETSDHNEGNE
jgi:hypothetical protein